MTVTETLGRALAARTSRRGLLSRLTLLAAAMTVAPKDMLLRPISAYEGICGPDSTAASGFSVFCCSVNGGVNECPPGTFAGGWWKADSSPYCCSDGRPGARYYIDCQAECTCRHSSYAHFCTTGCTECSCSHGTGSCDQRRVCCAQFRYGQCHTEIGLSGAVACRVVTCTPPYELFEHCSSSSATDNGTALHTAPCLPGTNC